MNQSVSAIKPIRKFAFQNQCDTMLKTQQRDLDLLEKRRDAELTRLNAHLDVSKRKLGKRFRRANANEVVAIATDLQPGETIPKALQLQTVRGRPAPPPEVDWEAQYLEGSAEDPVKKLWSKGGSERTQK
jgi:hypothetical protein